MLPYTKGSTHEVLVHFRPSHVASSGQCKFALNLEASFMAPLGAPTQKLPLRSFFELAGFAFLRLELYDCPFLCRSSDCAGADTAGELQLERSGGRAHHGRAICCT